MELYEALMTTRSMRRLTDDPPVTDEEIEHCLRRGARAPSGGNVQPYHFVVITDAEARAAMADLYLRGWRRYRPAMVAALHRSRRPRPRARSGAASSSASTWPSTSPTRRASCSAWRPTTSTLADDEGPLDVGTLHVGLPGRAELHPRRPR